MTRRSFYSLLGVPRLPSDETSSTDRPASARTFDPAHKFVTSPIFRNPFVFGSLRLLAGVYTLTTTIYLLAYYSIKLKEGESFFSYFTYLGYIGICAYLFASGTQTILYALRWRKNGAGAGYPLQKSWPRPLQAMHVVLYATVVTFPFIVTIVYWSLLSSEETFHSARSSWSALSVHVLNLVFALGEIALTNSPPAPWITLPITILFLCGYIGVVYITKATQGFYTYSFLDPNKSGSLLPAYIIGTALGHCIIFTIVHYTIRLRQHLALKYHRVLSTNEHAVRRTVSKDALSPGIPGEDADDEWEEVRYPGATPKGQRSKESVGASKVDEDPNRRSGGESV